MAAVPAVVLQQLPVNTLTEPRLTPGGLATQYSSVGHYDLAGPGDRHHRAGRRRALPGLPARQPVVHLAGLHQPPDLAERHSGAGGSGRQDPDRGHRREPRRDELARNARPPQGLPAVPLAAGVARTHRGRRPDRRGRRHRRGGGTRCRTTSRTRSPKRTGGRGSRAPEQIADRMLG